MEYQCSRLVFRNIVVEDPRPTLQHWMVAMQGVEPWSGGGAAWHRGPGNLVGVTFHNISIAAPSVLGEPDILWGMEDGLIYGLVFENVTIGGEPVVDIQHFHHNEFVL